MGKKLNLGHVTLIKNWVVANFVSATREQSFTSEQKEQARVNIGVETIIGKLADLTTTVKTSIVAAINSVNSRVDDIVAGYVTGVKGSAETEYRTGDVNITKDNIGLGNVDNTADMDKPMSTATKEYVDDQISTSSAIFRGSVAAADDTEEAAQTALAGITTKDKNDFAYVEVANTPGEGFTKVKRYRFVVPSSGEGSWVFEYALNNSGFTTEQLAALNSGITVAGVAQITINKDAIAGMSASIIAINTKLAAVTDVTEQHTAQIEAHDAKLYEIEGKFDENVSSSNKAQGKTYIDAGDEEATDAEVTAALNA